MRTKVIIGALAAVLLSALSTTALAKPSLPIPLPWGIVEKIHEIQRLPGIDIRNRYFGYVTERAHVLWIFGLYIRPVGYAIGVGEPADRKGSLITHERLIAMKRSGMIPADLPPTPSLSIMQYLGGFSLWITIGLFIILGRLTKDQDVKQPAPSRPRSPGVPAQPPSQSAPESRQTVAPDGLDLSIRDTPPPPPPLPQNRARCANPSCRRLLVPGKRQCPHCGSPYR